MTELILASGSATRQRLLTAAGVLHRVEVSPVDEASLRHRLAADGQTSVVAAIALAQAKAEPVSRCHPASWVIGADQILDLEGAWLEKPATVAAARAQLCLLRHRTHRLVSGVVLARDGEAVWRYADHAELQMRGVSDAFLDNYLAEVGPAVTGSVGAYHLEGPGAQLFTAVRGDFFTILGLPLLPLLAALRDYGVLTS